MSFDLTGQLVSSTYGRVVQYVSGSLYDGFGNPVSISGSGNINTGSFATTGSNRFNGNQIITGSIIFNSGSQITSTYYGNNYPGYIDIVAGAPDGFVELLSYNQSSSVNVDDYSVYITTQSGSLFNLWEFKNSGRLVATIAGGIEAPSFTGSLQGTSSYAANADLLDGKNSTIFTTTGSNTFIGNQTISGSLILSGSTQYALAYFDINSSLRTLPSPITSSGDTVAIFVSESNSWIMTNTIDGGTF
jgi:hypothetical protein